MQFLQELLELDRHYYVSRNYINKYLNDMNSFPVKKKKSRVNGGKTFLCNETSAKGTEFQESMEDSREFALGNTSVCGRVGNI